MADLKGKRLLFTGGAGLIGSHIVDQLCDEGCVEIVALRASSESLDPAAALREDERGRAGPRRRFVARAIGLRDVAARAAAQLKRGSRSCRG